MSRRLLYLCGMVSPVVFFANTFLGGALRPGYSHMSNTISELFTPGAPNKALLVAIHLTSAALTVLFGTGLLRFIRESGRSHATGIIAAWTILLNGVINMSTVTAFPQDVWGQPMTFPGLMHIILVGVLVLFAIIGTLLMGIWTRRARLFGRFDVYSYITVGMLLLSGVLAGVTMEGPYMGLSERLSSLLCLQWSFVLALTLYMRRPNVPDTPSESHSPA